MHQDKHDIESEGFKRKLERNQSELLEKDMALRDPLLQGRSDTSSQTAIIGANVCTIESLDYEVAENDVFKEDWRARNKVQVFQYIALKWILALLIGLATGLVGFFNNLAVENLAGFKLLFTSHLMQKESAVTTRHSLCLLVAICAYVAPAAAGSGIPEVKSYLNGVDAYSILAPSTLFVKMSPVVGILTRHDFMPEHILRLFPLVNPNK